MTHYTCANCGRKPIHRNGHSAGHARYRCTGCGHQARFVPAAAERAARYSQGEKPERHSQRSLVRVTAVARRRVANRATKSAAGEPGTGAPTADNSAAKALRSP